MALCQPSSVQHGFDGTLPKCQIAAQQLRVVQKDALPVHIPQEALLLQLHKAPLQILQTLQLQNVATLCCLRKQRDNAQFGNI